MQLNELVIFKKHFKLLIFVFLITIFIFYALFMKRSFPLKEAKKKFSKVEIKNHFVSDFQGKGFFEKNLKIPLKLFDFSKKIKIFLLEPRPDESKKKLYKIVLNDMETVVSSEDRVYLNYDKNLKKYVFSITKTPLWLSLDFKKSRIKIIAKYDLKGKESFCEKYLNLEFEEEKVFINNWEFRVLKNAILLPPDLFFKHFGNEEEKVFSKKHRLLLDGGKYQCFLGEGDFFIWKDDKWVVIKDLKQTVSYSLAQIKPVNSKSFRVDFWPKKAKTKATLILNKSHRISPLNIRNDFISDIRMRTQKQVSCKIEKQRFIIREKDVLFKKDGKWKIEKFYSFKKILKENKINSEFFVFDCIKRIGTKKIFKGYVFNKNRTQVLKIEKDISKRFYKNKNKKRK